MQKTIHLVSRGGRKIELELSVDRLNTRIVRGGFLADIVGDKHSQTVFHWVIQRVGCPEILQWGQEPSRRKAERAAESHLKQLFRKARPKKA